VRLSTLAELARVLDEAGVPFILVGGVAVVAHGYGRLTRDVDLVIELEPGILRRAFEALASLGYRPRVPVSADGLADPKQRRAWIEGKGMTVLTFDSDPHRDTPVDVFVTEPFIFDEEYRHALVLDIGAGRSVHVVRLATLLRMKDEAGRPQDVADAAELRHLHRVDEP
jgi:predicted nucleotidyltransferase